MLQHWCGRGMFLFKNLRRASNKSQTFFRLLCGGGRLTNLCPHISDRISRPRSPPHLSDSRNHPPPTNQQPTTVEMAAGMRKLPLISQNPSLYLSRPLSPRSFSLNPLSRRRPRPCLLDPPQRRPRHDVLRRPQRRQRRQPPQQAVLPADRHLVRPRRPPHLPMDVLLRLRRREQRLRRPRPRPTVRLRLGRQP